MTRAAAAIAMTVVTVALAAFIGTRDEGGRLDAEEELEIVRAEQGNFDELYLTGEVTFRFVPQADRSWYSPAAGRRLRAPYWVVHVDGDLGFYPARAFEGYLCLEYVEYYVHDETGLLLGSEGAGKLPGTCS